MQQRPKLYRLTRQKTAYIEHMILVFKKLSTLGTISAGTSGVATILADSRINLILPIVGAIIAYVSNMAVENLQFALDVSELKNPIKSDDTDNNTVPSESIT